MKKLDKFTLKSYIGPFVLTFFISVFVLLIQFLWKYIDDFVGKGFEWYVIAELMFYASATFVPMALPLAVLLSSLMTFGNLGENYELVAIKSAGISLQKVMRPLVVFIVFVSFGAFYFSNYVLPKANLEFFTLLSDVRKKKPAVSITEGVFNSNIGNFVIKVGKKDPDGVKIEDIIIYDHSKRSGNKSVTIARAGKMEMNKDKRFLILELEDGVNYDENVSQRNTSGNYPIQITRFSKEIQRIDLSAFVFQKSDKSLRRNNYHMLNVSQLAFMEDSLLQDKDSVLNKFIDYSVNDMGYLNKYFEVVKDTNKSYKADNARLKDSLDNAIKQQSIAYSDTPIEYDSIEDDEVIAESKIIVDSFVDENPLIVIDTIIDSSFVIEQKVKKNLNEFDTKGGIANIPKKDKAKFIEDIEEIAGTIPSDNTFVLDTNIVLDKNFIANFDSLDQVRMVVGALSMARNASYQSSNINKKFDAKNKYIAKYRVEWHRKFTLSIACIILFFIGAPLGAIIRKGGLGMPLIVSILMFVLYHVFTIIGEKSVKSQVIEPWEGMWMASIIYLPVGIFFTWKATTDAPLLDAEVWSKTLRKLNIFSKLKIKKK